MPVPLLEIQKSYDNGNTRESHLVNVYTPLNDSSYLLHLKFSTDVFIYSDWRIQEITGLLS